VSKIVQVKKNCLATLDSWLKEHGFLWEKDAILHVNALKNHDGMLPGYTMEGGQDYPVDQFHVYRRNELRSDA
jgi:hypothetical protein